MPVVISEIVTETTVAASPSPAASGGQQGDDQLETVVRRATERVLEILRREWDG